MSSQTQNTNINHCELLCFDSYDKQIIKYLTVHGPVADQGFPRRGGATTPEGNLPTYDLANFYCPYAPLGFVPVTVSVTTMSLSLLTTHRF